MASCAKGGDGTEEMGVEQRKRDQWQGSLFVSGDFHVIWPWAYGLVSFWPCQKCTFAAWEGDTLTQ